MWRCNGAGRHETALGFLERVPAHDDVPLGYVQHLTRGHVFDELNRPADAAAAYRRALDVHADVAERRDRSRRGAVAGG